MAFCLGVSGTTSTTRKKDRARPRTLKSIPNPVAVVLSWFGNQAADIAGGEDMMMIPAIPFNIAQTWAVPKKKSSET